MKWLFVADPIEKLNPLGDSTLALLRQALRRGDRAHWAVSGGVEFDGREVRVAAAACVSCAPDALPVLAVDKVISLSDFDAVFIRKDPPFDTAYVRLCWMLSLAESTTRFVNRPSLLLRYHEKLLPFEACAEGFLNAGDLIPTFIGPRASAQRFIQNLGCDRVVTKPFLGYGGRGVELRETERFLSDPEATEDLLVQPFHAEVATSGDRRVFFLHGRYLADVVRLPAKGGFVSNLAQGGTGVDRPLAAEEEAVIRRVGKFLSRAGIVLAGADLIGPLVSEINITSPTGIRSIEKLTGRDISEEILEVAGRPEPVHREQ